MRYNLILAKKDAILGKLAEIADKAALVQRDKVERVVGCLCQCVAEEKEREREKRCGRYTKEVE